MTLADLDDVLADGQLPVLGVSARRPLRKVDRHLEARDLYLWCAVRCRVSLSCFSVVFQDIEPPIR
jgi:hypothetical protein